MSQPNEPPVNPELPVERIRDVVGDRSTLTDEDRTAMQDLIDASVVQLPEHIFVKYLLPLTYARSGEEEYNVQLWRRIVGSLTADLRIVNLAKEVLFISPGLFPEMMLFADRTGKSMRWAELVSETIAENNIHPGLGEERLAELGGRALPTLDTAEHQEHRERWKVIWARYGVNGQEPTTEAAVITEQHATSEMEAEDEL